MSERPVLVAGGGIAGLALGLVVAGGSAAVIGWAFGRAR